MPTESQIPDPPEVNNVFAINTSLGQPISALDRLKLFSPDQWEEVTLELVSYWKTQYNKVVKCGGGGDMGRDVIAYSDSNSQIWQNYQCKHYKNPLSLSFALQEIGKLIYYAHRGEFSMPMKYYFVTPKGLAPQLLNHIMDPSKLKAELIAKWDKTCKKKITTTAEITLDKSLQDFIDTVDFTIFSHITPIQIIDLHSKTTFHAQRFGITPQNRPAVPKPPKKPDITELTYTQELLKAFTDYKKTPIDINSLSQDNELLNEFESARRNFYYAENLDRFSRDWLPQNSYEELLDECYESISPITLASHANGYAKYLATNLQATQVNYNSHPLYDYIKPQDKKGMCHQLTNLKKIKWTK